MPGLIVKVEVAIGDEVQEGQSLCTVEAMKMENILRAERKSVVSKIHVAPATAWLWIQSSWSLSDVAR